MNEYCKFSKFSCKFVLFFIYFELLGSIIKLLESNYINDPEKKEFPNQSIIESLGKMTKVETLLEYNDLGYHLLSGFIKFLVFFNFILFFVLQTEKLKIFHLKKIKNWFSLTTFCVVTILPGLIFDIIFEEIFFPERAFKD